MERWVSDRLHNIIGLSERHVAQFLVALAEKSRSSEELLEKIRDTETLDVGNEKVTGFVHELFDKVPHKQAGLTASVNREKERRAIELAQWNQSFKVLVDDDQRPSTSGAAATVPGEAQHSKTTGRRMRKREASESDEEEEPKLPVKANGRGVSKRRKSGENSGESDIDAVEAERLDDLRERDELAERLKQKEKEQTRKVAEKSEKHGYEEAVKRLHLQKEDRRKVVPQLREVSRREYLKKREVDKVDELEADIRDDEYLFSGEKLTKREKADLEYKRKVLQAAKEYRRAGEVTKVEQYHMPDVLEPHVGDLEEKKWMLGRVDLT